MGDVPGVLTPEALIFPAQQAKNGLPPQRANIGLAGGPVKE